MKNICAKKYKNAMGTTNTTKKGVKIDITTNIATIPNIDVRQVLIVFGIKLSTTSISLENTLTIDPFDLDSKNWIGNFKILLISVLWRLFEDLILPMTTDMADTSIDVPVVNSENYINYNAFSCLIVLWFKSSEVNFNLVSCY